VPRIDDQFLECVLYLYPSVEAADKGERAGGSGFLVAVESKIAPGLSFSYAVTNRHVAAESPVIRINTNDGGRDILELDPNHWQFAPDDDLAICNVLIDHSRLAIRALPLSAFLTKEIIGNEHLGPGDDVFMVGRFVNHEGKQRNMPSVRFGCISMMPGEPMQRFDGGEQEAFAVEMRSIGGYSGSPVFVHIMPLLSRVGKYTGNTGPWLLGVDYGHVFKNEPVRNEVGMPLPQNWHVRSNSGVIGVVPAWRLRDFLFQEELVQRRLNREIFELKQREAKGAPIEADSTSAAPSTTADNPSHKEDFNQLLDAAVRAPKSTGKTSR
jgi:hypothetical protein